MTCRINNIMMSKSLDPKQIKLYAARSKREVELHAMHEGILLFIKSQSRRFRVEHLVTKCNEAFMTVVEKNEDFLRLLEKGRIQALFFFH